MLEELRVMPNGRIWHHSIHVAYMYMFPSSACTLSNKCYLRRLNVSNHYCDVVTYESLKPRKPHGMLYVLVISESYDYTLSHRSRPFLSPVGPIDILSYFISDIFV